MLRHGRSNFQRTVPAVLAWCHPNLYLVMLDRWSDLLSDRDDRTEIAGAARDGIFASCQYGSSS